MARDREVLQLLSVLDQAYDRPSWHGVNLRGSLRRLTPRQLTWRPSRGRHSIWEIAVHAAYWKYAARRRFTGDRRGAFGLKGSNWFRRPEAGRDWSADLALLDDMHRGLRAAVAVLSARDLSRKPKGSKVSNFALLSGVAAHDLYHAGQIQLLKKLSNSAASSG